jgi:hypothetical protein
MLFGLVLLFFLFISELLFRTFIVVSFIFEFFF